MVSVPAFSTDEQIEASIKHLESIKQAMKDGKIARTEADTKRQMPKLMFSERTADELLQAVLTIKRLRETLEWYANPYNYSTDHLSIHGYIPIDQDSGKQAREALGKNESEYVCP